MKGGEQVNTNLLKAKIVENGDTQAQLAAALGISASNMNDKINGKSDFRQNEIVAIKNRYSLTADDVDRIFFDQ